MRIEQIAAVHVPSLHAARQTYRAPGRSASPVLARTVEWVSAARLADYPYYVVLSANRVVAWAGLLPLEAGSCRLDLGCLVEYGATVDVGRLLGALLGEADSKGLGPLVLEEALAVWPGEAALAAHGFTCGEAGGCWIRHHRHAVGEDKCAGSADNIVIH